MSGVAFWGIIAGFFIILTLFFLKPKKPKPLPEQRREIEIPRYLPPKSRPDRPQTTATPSENKQEAREVSQISTPFGNIKVEIQVKESSEHKRAVPLRKGRTKGILNHPINETPLAVIDFETTGLTAGIDRVVEVSVVRIEPGRAPYVALDTLVNPGRRMSATEIHGITDEDVKDAPRFADIAGDVARALADSVVSAYNVYFDIKFLDYELGTAGLAYLPPHLCLMYLRPMLGLGKRCSLDDACRAHGIPYQTAHMAASDALAAARLWEVYAQAMLDHRVHTFGDLANLKNYKFVQSFETNPLPLTAVSGLRTNSAHKSRSISIPVSPVSQRDALHEYWDALQTVLSDFSVPDEEIAYLTAKRQELKLPMVSLRSLHARAFADIVQEYITDKALDDRECQNLRLLHQCLGQLGWAPGQ